jgi:hypothetical protein
MQVEGQTDSAAAPMQQLDAKRRPARQIVRIPHAIIDNAF